MYKQKNQQKYTEDQTDRSWSVFVCVCACVCRPDTQWRICI